jgi:hypothetical protein
VVLLARRRNDHARAAVVITPAGEGLETPGENHAVREPAEGWYLMNTQELERMLRWWRSPSPGSLPPTGARLSIEEAIAYRDAGNLPDEHGRTLRLVLLARDRDEVRTLDLKRARFEPDFLDAPTWRRDGSKPVNVVPLRSHQAPAEDRSWWEEPDLAALESEWAATGGIEGLRIPEAYRGFVYKTILSLRAAGRPINVAGIADSIARWMAPEEAAEIRSALESANPSDPERDG